MIDRGKIHDRFLSEDPKERIEALEQLEAYILSLPDKQQAWNELIKLTNNKSYFVRSKATDILGSIFSHVPDKQQVWNDLTGLVNGEHISDYVALSILGSVFSQVPDKQQAWSDLHRFTSDEDSHIRSLATSALKSAFYQVPDKQQAWNDLHKLTNDKSSDVRSKAAKALGSVFSDVPDKQQAWSDLHKLTNDKDIYVRTYANHSLGKIFIFKASQAEKDKDYKEELENAITFFEKTAQESPYKWQNPAHFCLPFYRSFHTIVFKKQEAREEVNKYLAEAKDAIHLSKSKELLFEAVNNLANALREVQNLENLDLEAKEDEFNFYRKYCDRAAELMIETEETAPFATTAMRKGLPILDRHLKELLEEIQQKAKIAYKESKDTDTEEIACAVSKEVQKWEICSQEEMSWQIENLALVLKSKISHTLENKGILNMIDSMKYERELTRQYSILSIVIGLIPTMNVVPVEPVIEKIENSKSATLEEIRKIGKKLDDVTVYLEPGIREDLILHIGPITPYGGAEYVLTIPLQGLSDSEVKEELKRIVGKRINQLSMLSKKTAKIVEDYLIKNKMEDLLNKLR